MKLKALATCLVFLVWGTRHAFAAQTEPGDSIVYPLVIQFHSVCCGVPAVAPLEKFIQSFRKKNKTKRMMAWHIGPMGKEGEYWLAFSLKELSKKQATHFIRQVKPVVERLKDKGNATCEENLLLDKSSLSGRTTYRKQFF